MVSRLALKSVSEFSSLIPALSALLERVGSSPLNLNVSVCDAEEVKALKDKAADLESRLEALTKQYNHVEYLYRCEVLINTQLTDLCRDNGIPVRPALFERPSK